MSNQQNNQLKPDGFIKNTGLLKETEQVKDLLGFDKIIEDFRNYLDNIQESAIVGLIGPFGVGKSTMLYQLQEQDKNEKTVKWIKFDAWKYPDKKDLWEGFIFDFIQSTNPKQWKKIRQKIDGEETNDKKALLNLVASGLSLVIKKTLPFEKILKHFGVLFRSSPIKRVHEFQELLQSYIDSKAGKLKDTEIIYIVIEDIDRSQDGGIFFLETLHYFLKNYKLNKKIIIIAPINTDYLSQHNPTSNDKDEEIYLKSLDYTFYFNTGDIDFSDFIKEIIDLEQIDTKEELAINHIHYLLKIAVSGSYNLSLRRIKLLLREANNLYKTLSAEEQSSADVRVWLAFYFAKYIYNIRQKESILNTFQDKVGRQFKEINRGKTPWLYKLLLDISRDTHERNKLNYDASSQLRITLLPNYKYKIVRFIRNPFENSPFYGLSNIYISKLNIR